MGLLLDSNMIPIGMKIYPGNESENQSYENSLETLNSEIISKEEPYRLQIKGLTAWLIS